MCHFSQQTTDIKSPHLLYYKLTKFYVNLKDGCYHTCSFCYFLIAKLKNVFAFIRILCSKDHENFRQTSFQRHWVCKKYKVTNSLVQIRCLSSRYLGKLNARHFTLTFLALTFVSRQRTFIGIYPGNNISSR